MANDAPQLDRRRTRAWRIRSTATAGVSSTSWCTWIARTLSPFDVIVRHWGNIDLRMAPHEETALVLGTIYCKVDAVERQLKLGARPHLTNSHGNTALSEVARA